MDTRTVATYDQMASRYDAETVDFWEQFPRSFLDRFMSVSRTSVLDIGSGPGRDGLLLQNAGKTVTCLDASAEMVRLSLGRGLRSVQGTFESLPFTSGSFSAVWSYTSLLHIPKTQLRQALSEIRRVLETNGVFALGVIEGTGETYKTGAGETLPRFFAYYQCSEIITIVEEMGFRLNYFEAFRPRTRRYLNFVFEVTTLQ